MGKRFALAYANIYMANWEVTAFQKCSTLPSQYFISLDDIQGIWTHSQEEFLAFVNLLNSHHALIKPEPVIHETQITLSGYGHLQKTRVQLHRNTGYQNPFQTNRYPCPPTQTKRQPQTHYQVNPEIPTVESNLCDTGLLKIFPSNNSKQSLHGCSNSMYQTYDSPPTKEPSVIPEVIQQAHKDLSSLSLVTILNSWT